LCATKQGQADEKPCQEPFSSFEPASPISQKADEARQIFTMEGEVIPHLKWINTLNDDEVPQKGWKYISSSFTRDEYIKMV